MRRRLAVFCVFLLAAAATGLVAQDLGLGAEVAVARHLEDADLSVMSITQLIAHGRRLFEAMWTDQEGGGRPLTKGTGAPLADPGDALAFPRNFNRISAPDANSCAGCHNLPRSGGSGDIVANVFVLGQRFDFVTFDDDPLPTKASHDESGTAVTLDSIANSRATTGMFGAGYLEMLARQITAGLQALRDGLPPGQEVPLVVKGIDFGILARGADGSWDTSRVDGLPAPSLASSGAEEPPNLLIRPWHQAGAVISLRQFSNNAFNHHHGIQSVERFGAGADPDGDGFVDEMTAADVTAVSLFQATLPPPGRVIPRYRPVEEAIRDGERLFVEIGCGSCHVPRLPLDDRGWFYSEPNLYNPPGNLRGEPVVTVNLNHRALPGPRLRSVDGITWVEAFTDFKLHDITTGADDPNREPLDMQAAAGSEPFFAGNGRFLSKRLWGAASEAPYYHHGKYTTMRAAILAHYGEAKAIRDRFAALSEYEQAAIVEMLKSLQVLPEGAPYRVVSEEGAARRNWKAYWE